MPLNEIAHQGEKFISMCKKRRMRRMMHEVVFGSGNGCGENSARRRRH